MRTIILTSAVMLTKAGRARVSGMAKGCIALRPENYL